MRDASLESKLQKYKPYIQARTVGPAKAGQTTVVLPAIDHRAAQTPVKDQMSFGTCQVFAFDAGIEWAMKKTWNTTKDISEADAWFQVSSGSPCGEHVPTMSGAAAKLKEKAICDEGLKQYTGSAGACSTNSAICDGARHYGIAGYATFLSFTLGGAEAIGYPNDTNLIESFVDLGLPTVIGLAIVGDGWYDGTAESGVIDRNSNDNNLYGQHAMLVVGYDQPHGYFIVKNSWGTSWGHAGYAYLSYEYMQTAVHEAYVITGVRNPG